MGDDHWLSVEDSCLRPELVSSAARRSSTTSQTMRQSAPLYLSSGDGSRKESQGSFITSHKSGQDGVQQGTTREPKHLMTIRTSLFVCLFCTAPVLWAVIGWAALDLSLIAQGRKRLTASASLANADLRQKHVRLVMSQAEIAIQQRLKRMQQCALLLNNDFRSGLVPMEEDLKLLSRALHQKTVLFDVRSAFLGTRKGHFHTSFRRNDKNPTLAPEFGFASTQNGSGLQSVVERADLLSWPINDRGELGAVSLAVARKDYSVRSRPWWSEGLAAEGSPFWTKPYIALPEMRLAVDACAPIHGASDSESRTLIGVSCCHGMISDLSAVLANAAQESDSLMFVVEIGDFENLGKLVAAAAGTSNLDIQTEQEGSDPQLPASVDRYSAIGYPELKNKWISTVSSEVLRRAGSWEDALAMSFDAEFKDPDSGDDVSFLTETVVVNGTTPAWMRSYDAEDLQNRLSGWLRKVAAKKQFMNLRWLLVIALPTQGNESEVVTITSDRINEMDRRILRTDGIILVVCLFASLVCSLAASRPAIRSLEQLTQMMQYMESLQFQFVGRITSGVDEIESICTTFYHAQKCLQVFRKVLPEEVVQLSRGKEQLARVSDSEEAKMQVGQLCLKETGCSLVCLCFLNFEKVHERANGLELVHVLNLYLDTFFRTVWAYKGNISDFAEDQVLAYWTDSVPDHRYRALQASRQFLFAVRDLDLSEGGREHLRLDCSIGIHYGQVHLGSWGTSRQLAPFLKFGCVGKSVEIASRISKTARMFSTMALVSETILHEPNNAGRDEAWRSQVCGALSDSGTEVRFATIDVMDQPVLKRQCSKWEKEAWHRLKASQPMRDRFHLDHGNSYVFADQSSQVGSFAGSECLANKQSPGKQASSFAKIASATSLLRRTSTGLSSQRPEQGPTVCDRVHVPTIFRKASFLLTSMAILQITAVLIALTLTSLSTRAEVAEMFTDSTSEISSSLSIRLAGQLAYKSHAVVYTDLEEMGMFAVISGSDYLINKVDIESPGEVYRDQLMKAMAGLSFASESVFPLIGDKRNHYYVADARDEPANGWYSELFYGSLAIHADQRAYNDSQYSGTAVYRRYDLENYRPFGETVTFIPGGWNPRQRPYYNQTRWAQQHIRRDIYRFREGLISDSCYPVYTNLSLPILNPDSDPADPNAWVEALGAVTCSWRDLRELSSMLSQLDLGKSGVVFLVETTGPNDGMVIAAATSNSSLPVFDDFILAGTVSYVPRYHAQEYPRDVNSLISELSLALLDGKRSWSELKESTVLLRIDQPGLMNNYSSFAVRTSLLDGTIKGWKVGSDARWSPTDYREGKMRWLMVVAVNGEEFFDAQSLLNSNEEIIANFQRLATIIAITLCAVSLVMPVIFVRIAGREILGIQEVMRKLQRLDFQEDSGRVQASRIREFADLQSNLESLRISMSKLTKYVSRHLMDKLVVEWNSQSDGNISLQMEPALATIVSLRITNFGHFTASNKAAKVVSVLDEILGRAAEIICTLGGHLSDCQNGSLLTAFWSTGDIPDSMETSSDDAIRACIAAQALVRMVEVVNSDLKLRSEGIGSGLQVTIGINRGEIFIGEYGTPNRMKDGLLGGEILAAHSLATFAKQSMEAILVSNNVKEMVYGSFIVQFVRDTEVGQVYSLSRMSEWCKVEFETEIERVTRAADGLDQFDRPATSYDSLNGFLREIEWAQDTQSQEGEVIAV